MSVKTPHPSSLRSRLKHAANKWRLKATLPLLILSSPLLAAAWLGSRAGPVESSSDIQVGTSKPSKERALEDARQRQSALRKAAATESAAAEAGSIRLDWEGLDVHADVRQPHSAENETQSGLGVVRVELEVLKEEETAAAAVSGVAEQDEADEWQQQPYDEAAAAGVVGEDLLGEEGGEDEDEADEGAGEEEEQKGVPTHEDHEQQQQQQQQQASEGEEAGQQASAGEQPGTPRREMRCAIINNRPWHLDVAAGMAWAFQEAGCSVTLYLPTKNIFGIKEVMDGWFKGDHQSVSSVLEESYKFDVFAVATFPETHTSMLDALMNTELPGRIREQRLSQRFLAVVHNPNLLLIKRKPACWTRFVAMQRVHRDVWHQRDKWPALQPRRLQLITLAPFTATYLSELAEQWALVSKGPAGTIHVSWMPPLTPWLPSFAKPAFVVEGGSGGAAADISTAEGSSFSGSSTQRHLCIQGILDPMRRDYAAAFEAVSHPSVLAQLRQHNESLLLLGHVSNRHPLTIPPHLQAYVHNISGLPYTQEYYDTLARCRAILPAFASDTYLVSKSSSTVATAINVGTPLVLESRVWNAFSFLSPDALFLFEAPKGATPPNIPSIAKKDAQLYLWMNADVMLDSPDRRSSAERWTEADDEEEQAGCGGELVADQGSRLEQPQPGGMQHAGHAIADSRRGVGARLLAQSWQATKSPAAEHEQKLAEQVQQHAAVPNGEGQAKVSSSEGRRSGGELPEPGSYAHALLQLFEAGASSAAHAATWQLKAQLMQHNKELAARFLEEAVQLATAVAMELQAEQEKTN